MSSSQHLCDLNSLDFYLSVDPDCGISPPNAAVESVLDVTLTELQPWLGQLTQLVYFS